MLLLLCRWAYAGCKYKGQLSTLGSIHAAKELVSTCLSVVEAPTVVRPWKVFSLTDMLPVHPRPVSSSAASFCVACSMDGVLDFSQLRDLCDSEGDNGTAQANKWATALHPRRHSDGWSWKVHVFDFIALCIKHED